MSVSTSVSGIKNGYLGKESYYLKQQRKRWIVLNRNYLYSYKDIACTHLTEKIDLSKFDTVQQSENNEFELISKDNNKTYKRKFFASTNDICMEWIEVIKDTMQTSKYKKEDSKENIEYANDFHRRKQQLDKNKNIIMNKNKIKLVSIPNNLSNIMTKYNTKINQWDFDIFEFMNDPLMNNKGYLYLTFYIFKITNILSLTKINENKLINFLHNIEHGYKNNPYHNKYHSIDVFMGSYFMFQSLFFQQHMTIYDEFGIYIASLCHDLGHMGYNNNWYINTGDNLSLLYNDISVLENYHICEMFRVLNMDKNNWMKCFPLSIRRYLANIIRKTILATDMAMHKKKIKQFENMVNIYKKEINMNNEMELNKQRELIANNIKLYRCENISTYASLENIILDGYKLFKNNDHKNVNDVIIKDKNDDEKDNKLRVIGVNDERIFILEITMHLVDISNPAKPINLAKIWASKYLKEAFNQGDNEKQNGIPISMGMDRETTTLPQSQIGFINYVVKTGYMLYKQLFETGDQPCLNLIENDKYWTKQDKKDNSQTST